MPRGPAPTPNQLRVLRGAKPHRLNKEEPATRDLTPHRPEWLSEVAGEEWERIVPDLLVMQVVKRLDSTSVGAYCEAVARFRAAAELVARAGLLIRNAEGNLVKNPAVAQMRDASHELRLWSRELGLTPSARQPLRVEHIREGSGASELLG